MADQQPEKVPTNPLERVETSSNDDASDAGKNELQAHRTISRVPGNANYYEVNGLRTEGDDQDHSTENKKNLSFILTITGCAMGLCASQIMALLYLTVGTAIAEELNTDLFVWMLTASNIASGAIAPWVGPLADLIGRRAIFLWGGFGLSALAAIICAAAPNGEAFTAGQVIFGIGNVVQDLMSLAIVAESVPTSKRPMYTGIILLMIIPWAPGTLYANLVLNISFRWIGLILAIWNVIGFVVLWIGYKEPPRVNSRGLTRMQLIGRIDWIGGAAITIGLVLIMVALNAGGDGEGRFPWSDSRVLVPLVLGFVVFFAALAYEYFWAPYPLFPRRIIHAPRAFTGIMLVIFGAGVNYIALVVFVPIQARAVFQGDNTQVGIWMIPIGTCILGGAIVSAFLLAVFKKHVQWVMWTFCVIQTIACACLVTVDPFNINTLWPSFILALFSVGAVLVPNQVIITIITPDDLLGSVTALTVGLRAQCQAIGLAIFYNQFVGVLSTVAASDNGLTPAFLESGVAVALIGEGYGIEEITAFATRMMSALSAMPYRQYAEMFPVLDTPEAYEILQPRIVEIFTAAFERLWYISIAFGVFACIAGLFVGDLYKYQDDHVAVKMS